LLRNVCDLTRAQELSQRLLACIRQPYTIDEKEVVVGGSLGLSLFPIHGDSVDALMSHSDIAMYAAKKGGKNLCQTFTQSMAAALKERTDLQADLEQAIANDDLFFLYQPQFSVESGELVGVEALIRWNHPQKGMIAPNDFIPIIEEIGFATRITTMALNRSLAAIAILRERFPDVHVAVNVSALDFVNLPLLMKRVDDAIKANQLPGSALELELTERIFLQHTKPAHRAIETWKKAGIRVAIDDFGTGFSSLQYLLNLPVDTLKIDKSFVRSLRLNTRQCGIVKTILAMSNNLRAHCVAEGVETRAELQILRDIGCHSYQGYLSAEPMMMDEIIRQFG